MSATPEQTVGRLRLEPQDVSAALQEIFDADGASKAHPVATPSLGLNIDPERVEHDIAKLVLTLMEFLRRLMELQAIRRMEAGSLSEDEEEKLGETLMKAREKILEMAEQFGLGEQDLSLDLGPLGKLM